MKVLNMIIHEFVLETNSNNVKTGLVIKRSNWISKHIYFIVFIIHFWGNFFITNTDSVIFSKNNSFKMLTSLYCVMISAELFVKNSLNRKMLRLSTACCESNILFSSIIHRNGVPKKIALSAECSRVLPQRLIAIKRGFQIRLSSA